MEKKTNEDVNLFMNLHNDNDKIVVNSLNGEAINVEEITSTSKTIQNIEEIKKTFQL